MTLGAFLLVAAFSAALGYAAGRIDRADLGPLRRRRKVVTLDALTLIELQKRAERRRRSDR